MHKLLSTFGQLNLGEIYNFGRGRRKFFLMYLFYYSFNRNDIHKLHFFVALNFLKLIRIYFYICFTFIYIFPVFLGGGCAAPLMDEGKLR